MNRSGFGGNRSGHVGHSSGIRMNRGGGFGLTRGGLQDMTVGSLLDAERTSRKRSYQEIGGEDDAARSEEEERVARELVTMAIEAEKNQEDLFVEYTDNDLPDEIECQLIQKTLLINGTVQTIDFIMCNQCPRLFRTENLLWNHIKGKHNRSRNSSLRKTVPPPPRALPSSAKHKRFLDMEPGEIENDALVPYLVGPDGIIERQDCILDSQQEDLDVEIQEEEEEESDPLLTELSHDANIVADDAVAVTAEEVEEAEKVEKAPQVNNHKFTRREENEPRATNQPSRRGGKESLFVVGVDNSLKNKQNYRPEFTYSTGTGSGGKFVCYSGDCKGESFSSKKQIEYHFKRVHDSDVAECDLCGKHVMNLRRHKEVSHKKFRIYECSHCDDKYCSPEDLDRHLRNVESENRVSRVDQEYLEHFTNEGEDGDVDEKEERPERQIDPVKAREVAKLVKELEAQTFSCSDCGVKTPSRMTYIHHVLNNCIMDSSSDKANRRERKPRIRRDQDLPKPVTKHVIIQHERGRREHIIIQQDRDLGDAVREQLGTTRDSPRSIEKSIHGSKKRNFELNTAAAEEAVDDVVEIDQQHIESDSKPVAKPRSIIINQSGEQRTALREQSDERTKVHSSGQNPVIHVDENNEITHVQTEEEHNQAFYNTQLGGDQGEIHAQQAGDLNQVTVQREVDQKHLQNVKSDSSPVIHLQPVTGDKNHTVQLDQKENVVRVLLKKEQNDVSSEPHSTQQTYVVQPNTVMHLQHGDNSQIINVHPGEHHVQENKVNQELIDQNVIHVHENELNDKLLNAQVDSPKVVHVQEDNHHQKLLVQADKDLSVDHLALGGDPVGDQTVQFGRDKDNQVVQYVCEQENPVIENVGVQGNPVAQLAGVENKTSHYAGVENKAVQFVGGDGNEVIKYCGDEGNRVVPYGGGVENQAVTLGGDTSDQVVQYDGDQAVQYDGGLEPHVAQYSSEENTVVQYVSDQANEAVQFVDAHDHEIIRYGGEENQVVQYDGDENQVVQYGGEKNQFVQYGGEENQVIQYGGEKNQFVQYGGEENHVVQYGGEENQVVQYGGEENQVVQYVHSETGQSVIHLQGESEGQVLHIVEGEEGEETHVLINHGNGDQVLQILHNKQEEEEVSPLIQVLEDQGHTGVQLQDQGHTGVQLQDQGHPGVQLQDQGHPGVQLQDQGHPGVQLQNQGHPGVQMLEKEEDNNVLQVVAGEGGHVIHVTEAQLARLQAQADSMHAGLSIQ